MSELQRKLRKDSEAPLASLEQSLHPEQYQEIPDDKVPLVIRENREKLAKVCRELDELKDQQTGFAHRREDLEKRKEKLKEIAGKTLKPFARIFKRDAKGRSEENLKKIEGQLTDLAESSSFNSPLQREISHLELKRYRLENDQELWRKNIEKSIKDLKKKYDDYSETLCSKKDWKEELNECFIEKSIRPMLIAAIGLEEITETQAAKCIRIIRKYLGEPRSNKLEGEQFSRVNSHANEMIEGFPYKFGQQIKDRLQEFRWFLNGEPFENPYNMIIELIVSHMLRKKLDEVIEKIKGSAFPEDEKRFLFSYSDWIFHAKLNHGRREDLDVRLEKNSEATFNNAFNSHGKSSGNILMKRWSELTAFEGVQNEFGTDLIDEIEEKLAQITQERLILAPEPPEEYYDGFLIDNESVSSLNLVSRLIQLAEKNTKLNLSLTPFIILNAYHANRSGLKPLLIQADGREDGTDSIFYKFLNALSSDRIEALKKEHIPAVGNIIATILNHPETCVYKPKISEPIDDKIEDHLRDICIDVLSKESSKEQVFVIRVLKQLGNGTKYLQDALLNSQAHPEIQGKICKGIYQGLEFRVPKTGIANPEVPQEKKLTEFQSAFVDYLKNLQDSTSPINPFQEVFATWEAFHMIARHPGLAKEVMTLPIKTPKFFELIAEGGPLYNNRTKVIKELFANNKPSAFAQRLITIFTKKIPAWKQRFLYTDLSLRDRLEEAASKYPITTIGPLSLEKLVQQHKQVKSVNKGQQSRLESCVSDQESRNALIDGKITSIPFIALSAGMKRMVFRDTLRQSMERSRDPEKKRQSDERNRQLSQNQFSIPPGTYMHGSAVDFIDEVFLNGNLPGEALGDSPIEDLFPFHTDFAYFSKEFLDLHKELPEKIEKSISVGYGTAGKNGGNGQIFYFYDRNKESYEAEKIFFAANRKNHTLILGGMPATEISAIVLRDQNTTLAEVKQRILENGFYIPVYDYQGTLIFSANEYDQARDELNLRVKVEVWDSSLQTADKLGSNPGGVFAVPTEIGSSKHYVKFEGQEKNDHIWVEHLADMIYKKLDIAVPETKIVKIEGKYGHASKWLDGKHADKTPYCRKRVGRLGL